MVTVSGAVVVTAEGDGVTVTVGVTTCPVSAVVEETLGL
jgi:hypothetical protein